MTRQRIIIIARKPLTTWKQMRIEEVGTNWKTRPNQAAPTIQWYQSGQTLIY